MKQLAFGTRHALRSVLALGFFDCVHRGHRALLQRTAQWAEALGAAAVAFTFDNDPSAVLGVGSPTIYGLPQRMSAFSDCGIDHALCAHFDRAFMELDAESFVERLTESLGLVGVVCGEDYTFGRGAEGNVGTLKALLGARGIPVEVVPFVCDDGQKIATRQIRAMLSEGAIERANGLLGAPFCLLGRVQHGRGEGRRHDCPTFNLALAPETFLPADGVYGTLTAVGGKTFFGVTNVGAKPTFGDPTRTVETHLIGFDGDLYGSTLAVRFVKRLRGIETFETIDALYAQIERDKRWYR